MFSSFLLQGAVQILLCPPSYNPTLDPGSSEARARRPQWGQQSSAPPAVAPHPLLLESWTLVTAVSPLSATISSFALAPQSLRLLSKSLVPHPGHALGIVGMETAAGRDPSLAPAQALWS